MPRYLRNSTGCTTVSPRVKIEVAKLSPSCTNRGRVSLFSQCLGLVCCVRDCVWRRRKCFQLSVRVCAANKHLLFRGFRLRVLKHWGTALVGLMNWSNYIFQTLGSRTDPWGQLLSREIVWPLHSTERSWNTSVCIKIGTEGPLLIRGTQKTLAILLMSRETSEIVHFSHRLIGMFPRIAISVLWGLRKPYWQFRIGW